MQMRKIALSVLLTLVTGCSVFNRNQPMQTSQPPTTTTSAPIVTPCNVPKTGYNVDYCGVCSEVGKNRPSRVLLTIDDYPSDKGVEGGERMIEIADWARRAGVMMEAFPIKSKIDAHKKATGVDLVAELRKRGTYVSNHTYSHLELPKLPLEKVLAEVHNGVQSTYLRPPYGAYTSAIQHQAEVNGYRLCLWNIDTNDWRPLENGVRPPVNELVQRVHAKLMTIPAGTPIVILGHYFTNYPAALSAIVDEVKRMGNQICTAPKGPVGENAPFPIC